MTASLHAADTWIKQGAKLATGWRLLPTTDIRRGPAGSHLLNTTGSSLDFHDFRAYQMGDDLRQVDWSVYARSDALVIRQYREEISPVLEVYLDASGSMGAYPGKQVAAVLCASFLAGLARGMEGRPILVTGGRRYAGAEFEHGLVTQRFRDTADVTTMASWGHATGKPVRCIISDFLFPADMHAVLTPLRRDAAALILIQILASSEREPTWTGGVRFRDVEHTNTHRDLRLDASAVARYRTRLEKHMALLDDAASRLNASLIRLDEPDDEEALPDVAGRCADMFRKAGVIDVA